MELWEPRDITYFYQREQMKVFRDIYKRRIAGYTDDIYQGRILQKRPVN